MTDGYWRFYEHWRKDSARSRFRRTFPYKLSLGADSKGVSLLPFRRRSMLGDQILVTKSYEDTFHRLLGLRDNDKGDTRGVVLTGQPGIGTPYDQILVPCDNSPVYPFSRKINFSYVHARATYFSSPGHTPVRQS